MNQRQVGRGKRVGANLGRSNPATGFTSEGLRFASQNGASIETESDLARSIAVIGGGDLFEDRDGQSQFFHDFSSQASLEALTRLPLAAGKLPQPTQRSVDQALGDEDLPVPDDEASRYLDGRRNFRHALFSLSRE